MHLFAKSDNQNKVDERKGLFVTLDELIDQQKYLPYLSLKEHNLTSNRSGDVKSAFKGRGMELEEVRAYTFGDDIRDINWRITARKSEPYTKVYSEEKDRVITVCLDLSASMIFGTRNELKSVTAAKIAALLGWLSIHNKDRFSLLIYDGKDVKYFKPQNNRKNLMVVFKSIAEMTKKVLHNNTLGNFADALKSLQYHQKGRGTLFILSDFYHFNQDEFKNISTLAKHNRVYCINIFDILEEVAPQNGEYTAQYGNIKITFNSASEVFKQEYQRYFLQNRENIKKNCQKFLCKYIEIRTDVPIFKQLRLS